MADGNIQSSICYGLVSFPFVAPAISQDEAMLKNGQILNFGRKFKHPPIDHKWLNFLPQN